MADGRHGTLERTTTGLRKVDITGMTDPMVTKRPTTREKYEDQDLDDEVKTLEDGEQEAYALAEEAQRTLQQARDAVAKARQARGYWEASPALGQNKKRGGFPTKRKNGSPGPCTVCGKGGHRYFECPMRFGN